VGDGRAPSDADRLEILSDASKDKFVLGTLRPAQSEPTKLQDALQVGEPHLDLFAFKAKPLDARAARFSEPRRGYAWSLGSALATSRAYLANNRVTS
jgi:hypothetical protein